MPRRPSVQTTFLDPVRDARVRVVRARIAVRVAWAAFVDAVALYRAEVERQDAVLRAVLAEPDAQDPPDF